MAINSEAKHVNADEWRGMTAEQQADKLALLKRLFDAKQAKAKKEETKTLARFNSAVQNGARVRIATFILSILSALFASIAAVYSQDDWSPPFSIAASVFSAIAGAGIATTIVRKSDVYSDNSYRAHHEYDALYHEYDLKWQVFVGNSPPTYQAYLNAYELCLSLTRELTATAIRARNS